MLPPTRMSAVGWYPAHSKAHHNAQLLRFTRLRAQAAHLNGQQNLAQPHGPLQPRTTWGDLHQGFAVSP